LKYSDARTSERTRLTVVCSSTSSAQIARECRSSSTKQYSGRTPPRTLM
jgi:hypothetical protein